MSEQHPDRPKRRGRGKKRHTVMKVVGATAVVMALVTGLSVVYAYRHLNGNLQTDDIDADIIGERVDNVRVAGPQEPLDILVMGSDSRAGKNNIDGLTGLGERSDTTLLVHLSADRKRAYGVSIPRDTLVPRPECKGEGGDVSSAATDQMWNAAFTVGGAACTIKQFEDLSGIRIEHSVVVDFNGFQDMVDAVGGVQVCIPATIDDREHGIFLEKGTREITGKQALSYVRVRNVGDGSDLGRIKRQQAFLASMAKEVVSAGTLANPIKLYRFLDAATRSVRLDDGLDSLKDIADLGYQFRSIGLNKIQFVTIPWQYAPDDPNRVRLLQPQADLVFKRLRHDEPLTLRQTGEAISAENVPDGATRSPSGPASQTPSATPTPTRTPTGKATPTRTPTINPKAREANERAGLCS